VSTKEIVIAWIKSKSNQDVFYSYDLEQSLPVYGRLVHQKVHTASTYARAFRDIRESNSLNAHGIKLEEVKHNNSKVKGWKIER